MERLAIFISGNGTTMQAILRAWKKKEISLDIVCIISSNPYSLGIKKAKKLQFPEKDIVVISPASFTDKNGKINQEKFGQKILKELTKRKVTVITQNNWMPLTPEKVIFAFPGRIFNQHPAIVPEFGGKGMFGKRVHAAVLLFNRLAKRENLWTEAIAQEVAIDFDQGSVVKSIKIPILPEDTVDSLQKRVLKKEHTLQINLLKDIAAGKVLQNQNREPYVKQNEKELLKKVKQLARILYPKG